MATPSDGGHLGPARGVGRTIGLLVVILVAAPAAAQERAVTGTSWVAKGAAERGAATTAQHAVSTARPIQLAPGGSPTQGTVLRWRTPSIAQAGSGPPPGAATSTAPSADAITTVTRIDAAPATPAAAAIRPVSLDQPVAAAAPDDAFADPFGDRAQVPAPPQQLPAGEIQPAVPVIPVADPPAPSLPDASARSDDPAPAPGPLDPPVTSDRGVAANGDCREVYNERDCCADGERCQEALTYWRRSAMAKISLDITPSFRPDEEDPYKEEDERIRTLAKSPVRTWRDRAGNVIGVGRMTNIKRGRLLILDDKTAEVVRLPFDDLSEDDLCFATAWWNVPTECSLADEQPYSGRGWDATTFTWKAAAACHKPLYFEEPGLERYGHTAGPLRQPVLSGAHFFLNLVSLPYQAGINPPWECRYPLGYYRPGSCAPYLVPPIPLSVRGGLWQAGAIVGGVALFP